MLLTMHGYCYDLYLLTFPGVRDVFPIIIFRRLLINADLLPQYGQTVFVLTCSSLNHDSSTQTIRNGLSTTHLAAAGNRAYMQSLISLALFICRIFPIDDSIGDSPFGIQIGIIFQLCRHIKPHGLDESFSLLLGLFQVFLLGAISKYPLEGHLKITLLLYSQTLPFWNHFSENFLEKLKSL